ncbi:MAG: hypothetical protein ACK5TB_00605 [bacterium]|jgi:hypothetical protein
MRPVPLLFMGIKRWQDIRPTDPIERVCGGDFAAFAAYYGMGDAEAGSTLLYGLQKLRDMLRKGDLEEALAFLEWQAGE